MTTAWEQSWSPRSRGRRALARAAGESGVAGSTDGDALLDRGLTLHALRALLGVLGDALGVFVGELEVLGERFEELRFGGSLLAAGVREERGVREQELTRVLIERLCHDVRL